MDWIYPRRCTRSDGREAALLQCFRNCFVMVLGGYDLNLEFSLISIISL